MAKLGRINYHSTGNAEKDFLNYRIELERKLNYLFDNIDIASIILGLATSRLLSTNSSGNLESVTDLTDWIAGTTNQVTIADDGDGSVTLSLPQNIDTNAEPQFAGVKLKDTTAIGELVWNNTDKCIDVQVDTHVTASLSQELYMPRVVNKTGATITNGSVVYIDGAQGNRPTINLADCDTYATSYKTIGIATEDIANNGEGFVTTHGLVRGLNTSIWSEGDCLYLSSTAGGLTATKPTDGKTRIFVGMVVYSHNNDGIICVKIQQDKYMFGDIDNSDYTYFESDGTMVSIGDSITYRDEYVGGEYFVPSGASAPDEVNVTIGGVVTKKYAFDGATTDEKLGNTFEIAHDIALTQVNAGTEAIEFHVHLGPSDNNTGVARFTVDWCLIKSQGAPIAGTQQVATKTITANQQYYNLICGCDLPVPLGGFGIGDLIEFTITRTPTHVDDTYASDIIFYKAALHVPIDMLGSRQRYIK